MASKIDLTFSSILWHYLIKGFEDLKLFPDNYIAIQMLTIRLCRLKSMPDPQKIINDENLQNEIIIKNELNVPILTDIHNIEQCTIVANHVDVLQIPAFLCRQTDLLVAAAKTNKIINVKKGQFLAPLDKENVTKKISDTGNNNILVTE